MLKIVFMGTPNFSVPILEALIEKYDVIGVVTQPDRKVGRHQELVASPVKECAIRHGIKIFQPTKIRVEYEDIVALAPDLIVTAAYGQIIGKKVLEAPKYHCINVHGSLLPAYRGGAPIQRAIINGDTVTGITIMYMERGMDSGDILLQKSLPIEPDDTSGTLFEKLSILGRDALMEAIPLVLSGEITPIKQDESKVTFAYNLTAEDEKLDFNKEARVLVNQIRGLLPDPVAYMMLGDDPIEDKYKVYKAEVSSMHHQTEVGKVINKTKKYFTISCGNSTALDIYCLQPLSKKPMPASDFINGRLKKYY